ncbi:MAG: hypothetical protein IT324_09590, partial [Anaerolineae bacterium]|nr:hypothetical protein [Anaerolineae bacterium]
EVIDPCATCLSDGMKQCAWRGGGQAKPGTNWYGKAVPMLSVCMAHYLY